MDDEERGDSIFEAESTLGARDGLNMAENGCGYDKNAGKSNDVDIENEMSQSPRTLMTFKSNTGHTIVESGADHKEDLRRTLSNQYSLVRMNKSTHKIPIKANASVEGDITYTYVARSSAVVSNAIYQHQYDIQGTQKQTFAEEESEMEAKAARYLAQSNAIMSNILAQEGFEGFVENLINGK